MGQKAIGRTPLNGAELARYGTGELVRQDWLEKIDLICDTVAQGATPAELALFLHVAEKRGLDPLARQIYLVKRQGKGTIQVGIDGFRAIAHRTGACAGITDAEYGSPNDHGYPSWAKVTVYKMVQGQRCPFDATARWEEYYPGDAQGFQWKRMPHVMLAKCAEALALRKSFPEDLSGLYEGAEMDQAGKADAIVTEGRDVVQEQVGEYARHRPSATEWPTPQAHAAQPVVGAFVPKNDALSHGADEDGKKSFGYVPKRWPMPKQFEQESTSAQTKMAGDKAKSRGVAYDDISPLCRLVLAQYKVIDDNSKAAISLFIDWLMNSPKSSLDEAMAALEAEPRDAEFTNFQEALDLTDDGSQKSTDTAVNYEIRRVGHQWPTFAQAPDACRLAFSRILKRPIKNMADLGEEGWATLAAFADDVAVKQAEEPIEFQVWKKAEGLTNG